MGDQKKLCFYKLFFGEVFLIDGEFSIPGSCPASYPTEVVKCKLPRRLLVNSLQPTWSPREGGDFPYDRFGEYKGGK